MCRGRTVSVAAKHPRFDRSQLDALARHQALTNMKASLDKLPVAVPARVGRTLGVFRTSATVDWVAGWLNMGP
jgi:hypothetical protein